VRAGSHVVIGLAAWTWTAPHLNLPSLDPASLGLAGIGSLLPDVDHPRSWIGRRLWPISRPLAALFGHRGVTHSLVAVILCFVFLHWREFTRPTVCAVVVGYLSHLCADLLTTNGLRLAWPLRQRQSVPLCRTGSFGEVVIVGIVALFAGATILHAQRAFGF
jgi:inner membrane protein